MSKGIIVVGGTEEEHYNLLGKDRLHPIINVYPEENDIYNKLDSLLSFTPSMARTATECPMLRPGPKLV